jgi:hypothetical protein
MAANPRLTFRRDLTDFAMGIMPDYRKVLEEVLFFAPVVPTGSMAGRYAQFNSQQGFVAPNAKRAVGGATAEAKFGASMVDFVLDPNALKIPIDQEIEVPLAGENIAVVEQAKTETLLAQGTNCFAANVYTVLAAAVSAHATYGKWEDSAVDPIDELELAGFEIFAATGLYPNHCGISPQMFAKLRKNPLALKRFPGKAQNLALDQIAGELSFPCTMRIVTGAGLTGGGFDNAAATYAPLIGTAAWLFYSNPLATGLTPSFAATLSLTRDLLSGVYEYVNDDGTVRFLRTKWSTKPVIQSASLCRRIVYKA